FRHRRNRSAQDVFDFVRARFRGGCAGQRRLRQPRRNAQLFLQRGGFAGGEVQLRGREIGVGNRLGGERGCWLLGDGEGLFGQLLFDRGRRDDLGRGTRRRALDRRGSAWRFCFRLLARKLRCNGRLNLFFFELRRSFGWFL